MLGDQYEKSGQKREQISARLLSENHSSHCLGYDRQVDLGKLDQPLFVLEKGLCIVRVTILVSKPVRMCEPHKITIGSWALLQRQDAAFYLSLAAFGHVAYIYTLFLWYDDRRCLPLRSSARRLAVVFRLEYESLRQW